MLLFSYYAFQGLATCQNSAMCKDASFPSCVRLDNIPSTKYCAPSCENNFNGVQKLQCYNNKFECKVPTNSLAGALRQCIISSNDQICGIDAACANLICAPDANIGSGNHYCEVCTTKRLAPGIDWHLGCKPSEECVSESSSTHTTCRQVPACAPACVAGQFCGKIQNGVLSTSPKCISYTHAACQKFDENKPILEETTCRAAKSSPNECANLPDTPIWNAGKCVAGACNINSNEPITDNGCRACKTSSECLDQAASDYCMTDGSCKKKVDVIENEDVCSNQVLDLPNFRDLECKACTLTSEAVYCTVQPNVKCAEHVKGGLCHICSHKKSVSNGKIFGDGCSADKPICALAGCKVCESHSECNGIAGAGLGYCEGGQCRMAANDSEKCESENVSKPFSENKACRGCKSTQECLTRFGELKGYCDPASGECRAPVAESDEKCEVDAAKGENLLKYYDQVLKICQTCSRRTAGVVTPYQPGCSQEAPICGKTGTNPLTCGTCATAVAPELDDCQKFGGASLTCKNSQCKSSSKDDQCKFLDPSKPVFLKSCGDVDFETNKARCCQPCDPERGSAEKPHNLGCSETEKFCGKNKDVYSCAAAPAATSQSGCRQLNSLFGTQLALEGGFCVQASRVLHCVAVDPQLVVFDPATQKCKKAASSAECAAFDPNAGLFKGDKCVRPSTTRECLEVGEERPVAAGSEPSGCRPAAAANECEEGRRYFDGGACRVPARTADCKRVANNQGRTYFDAAAGSCVAPSSSIGCQEVDPLNAVWAGGACRAAADLAECQGIFGAEDGRTPLFDSVSGCFLPRSQQECANANPEKPVFAQGGCRNAEDDDECRQVDELKPILGENSLCRAVQSSADCQIVDVLKPYYSESEKACRVPVNTEECTGMDQNVPKGPVSIFDPKIQGAHHCRAPVDDRECQIVDKFYVIFDSTAQKCRLPLNIEECKLQSYDTPMYDAEAANNCRHPKNQMECEVNMIIEKKDDCIKSQIIFDISAGKCRPAKTNADCKLVNELRPIFEPDEKLCEKNSQEFMPCRSIASDADCAALNIEMPKYSNGVCIIDPAVRMTKIYIGVGVGGGIVVILLIILIVFLVIRHKKSQANLKRKQREIELDIQSLDDDRQSAALKLKTKKQDETDVRDVSKKQQEAQLQAKLQMRRANKDKPLDGGMNQSRNLSKGSQDL